MNNEYSLTTILEALAKKNGKKRFLYNFGAVGGWSSKIIIIIFFSLPFIEFAVLFNPYSFAYLGIAQSVIFYIVFSSMLIILVAAMTFALNANLVRKITPSWDFYFAGRDITMVVSSGINPYSKFFDYYALLVKDKPSQEELYSGLLKAFETMQEDNKDLLDAMNRSTHSSNQK
ncbi:MAG: hypothetical protein JKY28_04010 [Sulfurimonas sp.]|nr:hypothetical protein [Sulfurimonas sp.]